VIHESGFRSYRLIREHCENASVKGSLLLGANDGAAAPHNFATQLDFQRLGSAESMSVKPDEALSLPLSGNQLAQRNSPAAKTMNERYYSDDDSAFFLAGYGATRRMELGDYRPASLRSKMMARYQRTASLFADDFALLPFNAWLPDLKPKRRKEVTHLIRKLLPDENVDLIVEPDQGEYNFKKDGLTIPFSALSDGYRAFLAWTTDLIGHLCLCSDERLALKDMEGVVLVDEVDLHLHPEWQMVVVEKISTTFPKLQFILTSHSPIVAGTLPARCIFHSYRDDQGHAVLSKGSEEIRGQSAEQILLSPYFGLKTTRSKGMHRKLEERSRRANDGDLAAAEEYLELAGRGSR